MGWISVVFAHRVIDLATPPGDGSLRGQLLDSVGLGSTAAVDPEQRITDTAFYGLLESISERAEHGRDVALRVGASMRCDDYGAFGMAFKTAIDLEGSYLRVERYGRIVTSIANFRLVRDGRSTFMEVIPGDENRSGLRMTNELALGAATALSREVGDASFTPAAAHLTLPAPGDGSAFEEHFRCPLHFGAPRDALELNDEQLRTPNRLGDASISKFFDTHLDRALGSLPESDLAQLVQAEIKPALSEGAPSLDRVAARLGLSSRTLQRRLRENGLSYRTLVSDARYQLAMHLLRTTDYSLVDIAFLTGFSEQSAFQRAFKRWTGTTPRAFRQEG
ncbi:MAG: AraC family transcriptional regulator ligand-binding domain-containing protein [Acidobacteriota bacterium]